MDRHVRTAGWLNIALGLVCAVAGPLLLWRAWREVDGGWVGEGIFLGYVFGAILMLLALAYVVIGAGMVKGRNWAKVLAVAVSVPGLLSFPFGTVLSVYTIWAVTRGEARLK